MSLARWEGKVALVTGASSGIGEAAARRLGAAKMKVVLAARREARLKTLAADLPEAMAVPTDLRDEASILSLFDKVRETWGGVDVLVNNAGLGRDSGLSDGKTEHWREMLDVNVLALCICTREALTDMRRTDLGHVIHIGSMASHRVPSAAGAFYSATKHAVKGLTEGLRKELRQMGSQIRISQISPGVVKTEFAEALFEGDDSAIKEMYSRFPPLQAGDIADAIEYVLSAPSHVQVHDVLMRPTEQAS